MEKISAFLKRIGLDENTKIEHTVDFLKLIQYHAVTHLPYENIDIINGVSLKLEAESLFDKIVVRGRGGYCFELNALLSHILKEMGFEVTDYLARFLRGVEGIPVRHHRVVAVKLENKTYICDIGIGSKAPRHPLELTEGIAQTQFGEIYEFSKDETLGWVLWEHHKGEKCKYISFTEDKQLEMDFILPSFYCEKHPDSKFNKALMVAMKTEKGRKTINGNEYKEFVGDLVVLEEKLTEKALNQRLEKDFFNTVTFKTLEQEIK